MFRPLTLAAAAAGTLLLAACQETGTESPLEPRSLATGNASDAKDLASDCAPNRGLERSWPKRIDVVNKHASAGRSDAAADVAAGLIADVTGLYDCSDSDSAELVLLILQIAGLVLSDPDPESQALIAQALAAGDAGFVAPIDLSTGGEATSENQCGGVSVPIQPGGGTILVVGFEVDGDPDPFAPGFQSFRHRYRFETIPAGFEFDAPALAAVELIEAGLGEVDLEDVLYARLRNGIVQILGEDVGTRDDAGAEELLACTDITVALSGWQGWVARALTPATKVLGIDPLFASPAGLGARVSAFSIYAGVVPIDGDGGDGDVTYFADGFEEGLEWTPTGFWNRTTGVGIVNTLVPTYVSLAPDDDSGGALPEAPEGMWYVWYGQAEDGNYIGEQVAEDVPGLGGTSTASHSGSLVSPAFTIPESAEIPALTFRMWYEIESVTPQAFDLMTISIIDVEDETVTELLTLNEDFAGFGAPDQPFTSATTSGAVNQAPSFLNSVLLLGDFIGREIQIVLTFSTGDVSYNGFRGWIVDDVAVEEVTIIESVPGLSLAGSKVWSLSANLARCGEPVCPVMRARD